MLLTDAQLRATAVPVSGTVTASGPLTNTELRASPVPISGTVAATNAHLSNQTGTWGYVSGVSGTETLTGGKRVLQITAMAQQAAGSLTINGGSAIPLPYGATDKASSSITIEPRGNLVDPVLVFSSTVAYFVEWVL